jgi:WD40 repeat protein
MWMAAALLPCVIEAAPVLSVKSSGAAEVQDLALSVEGGFLAAANVAGEIEVWSFPAGEPLATLREQNTRQHAPVLWTLGGTLYSINRLQPALKVWQPGQADLSTTRTIPTTGAHLVEVHPEQGLVLFGDPALGNAALVDYGSGKLLKDFRVPGSFNAMGLSPDGQTAAFAQSLGRPTTEREEWKHKLFLWDMVIGRKTMELEGHRDQIPALVFSPDGRTLYSMSGFTGTMRGLRGPLQRTSPDSTIRRWDALTGKELESRPAPEEATWSAVALHPDGTRMLAAAGASLFLLDCFDLNNQVAPIMKGESPFTAVEWAGKGDLFLTADKAGNVSVWRAGE